GAQRPRARIGVGRLAHAPLAEVEVAEIDVLARLLVGRQLAVATADIDRLVALVGRGLDNDHAARRRVRIEVGRRGRVGRGPPPRGRGPRTPPSTPPGAAEAVEPAVRVPAVPREPVAPTPAERPTAGTYAPGQPPAER